MMQLDDLRYAGEEMFQELENYTLKFEEREAALAEELKKADISRECKIGGNI